LAIADQSESTTTPSVERVGKSVPERMEIVRLDFPRSIKQVSSREDFCEQPRRILAEQFPDESVEKLSVAAEHTWSRIFVRGITRKGGSTERPGKSRTLKHRTRLKQPDLRAVIVATGQAVCWSKTNFVSPIYFAGRAKLHCWSTSSPHWSSQQRRKQSMRTQLPAIRRFGCVFGDRLSCAGEMDAFILAVDLYGKKLRPRTEHELQHLILKPKSFRNPLASDLRHRLYRVQPERSMQTIVMQDIDRVDVLLDPQGVYEQVIAESHGQHGVRFAGSHQDQAFGDLGTKGGGESGTSVTGNGRLALHLPSPYPRLGPIGLLRRASTATEPPIVYLVAPALRVHPTTETILSCLSPKVQVIRVGLTENWRRGIRVVMRQ
jgi:hypothetical protein